jgi:8-oxo-dGTP pyrophosphatase MutT (NUDIX family)
MAKKKKLIRKARKAQKIRQVAAVPCRLNDSGVPEILLVTSRTTRRFIIPKGWPISNKGDRRSAAIEAEEEAGVMGKVLRDPIGTYSYWKRLTDCFVPVEVTVFVLLVTGVAADWDERQARRRAWLEIEDAITLIDEPELAAMLREADLGTLLAAGRSA